jgi:hypothetical protein
VSPEHDDLQEDEEQEEFASRSIFAAGWFRAVLVLTVLAIVVVVSLPWLLNWFEPAPPPARTAGPADSAPPALAPAPPAPTTPAPAPVAPPAPGSSVAPTPQPRSAGEKPAPASPARKPTDERAAGQKSAADKGAAGKAAKAQEPAVRTTAPPPSAETGSGGGYWVQLGAFKDEKNAQALARTLRDSGFPVEVARVTRGSGAPLGAAQQHELFVTEAGVERVNAALKGRGSAQSAPGGVTVTPAFDLQEAMTISKRLTDQGLKVIIRPAGIGGAPGGAPVTLHVVRAGGYPDRPRAVAARDALSAKGHGTGIVTQGRAK